MVSFCDIPISRVAEHTKLYGDYGIGMNRDWGIGKGLTPVIYLNKKSKIVRKALSKGYWRTKSNTSDRLLRFIKPLEGRPRGSRKEVAFYNECEWRYVPASGENFDSSLEKKSKNTFVDANNMLKKNDPLKFSSKDVSYLIVPTEDKLEDMIGFINKHLKDQSTKEKDNLISRLFVLNTLLKDI